MKKWKSFRDISIKKKLVVTVIVIMLSSIFFVSILSYKQYTSDFQRQSMERSQQIIDQLSINIDNYLDELFKLSLAPYYSVQVIHSLEDEPSNTPAERYYKERLINNYLEQMMVTPRIDILRVFIIADQVYSGGRAEVIQLDSGYREEAWYQQALHSNDTIFIPKHADTGSPDSNLEVFSIVKQIRSLDHPGKILGILRVDANYTGLANIGDRVKLGDKSGILVYDQNRNIIYSSLKAVSTKPIMNRLSQNNESAFEEKIDGKRYLISTASTSRANWTIVSVNSVEEMNRNADVTRNRTLLIALLCSFIASVAVFLLIHNFMKPLLSIVKLMMEVKRGKLTVRFPETRGDEIGFLGASFNSMADNIHQMLIENTKLTKEMYEAKYLQKEAEFSALNSQIRPHFIYNTLNSIHILIQIGRTDKAMENIHQLSMLMRSITRNKKMNSVREEIELLEAYLGIQKSRFESRLEYSIQIEPVLLHKEIPSLTLQPIVENAVIHGCENRKETTRIEVFSRITVHNVQIHVKDNGTGMSSERVQHLNELLQSSMDQNEAPSGSQRSGIGLINVHRRLRNQYGQDFGIQLESILNQGTEVILTFPISLIRSDMP